MVTTVEHKGSVREWTGNIGQWNNHQECIIHWCDGGDIEIETSDGCWNPLTGCKFLSRFHYRKKERTPKAGEVWGWNGTLWIRVDARENFNGWVEIGGSATYKKLAPQSAKFLATSIEEYFKKLSNTSEL